MTANTAPPGLPLSQLPIWGDLAQFYRRLGPHAWRGGFIPEYITSNPFIANTYAELTLAYWQDADANAQNGSSPGPRYILELGAGSGRFAFHFLTRLTELLDARAGPAKPRFVYIMSDVAESNLAAWRENPQLATFVAAGMLDFGLFDAGQAEELTLLGSGQTLTPGALAGPGVVIANYLFDSIPCDLYFVEAERLYERRITLHLDGSGQATLHGEEDPARFVMEHSHREIDPDQPPHAQWASILRAHARQLDKTVFALPVAALHACRRLRRLMGSSLMLLVADRGYTTWQGLQTMGESEKAAPGLAFHSGGFSMPVNFPALACEFTGAGGVALVPDHEPYRLGVAAFLADNHQPFSSNREPAPAWPTTRRAFAAWVNDFGPDDFYVTASALGQEKNAMSLAQIMALLRLSRWDPQLLAGMLPTLERLAGELNHAQRGELYAAMERCVANDYPSTQRYDLMYGLGRFFHQCQDYPRALHYLGIATRRDRANAEMLYQTAVCQVELAQLEQAAGTLRETLNLAPRHQAARDLLAYVQRKRST